jgi:purine nucleosidase
VCAIIDPTILTTEHIPVDVETRAELSIGRTVCDRRFRSGKPANVAFAMDADEPKFNRMLLEILGRTA